MYIKKDLKWFEDYAHGRNVIQNWSDSIQEKPKDELLRYAHLRFEQAKSTYLALISSESYAGSFGYRVWAANIAFGTVPTKARHKASLNRAIRY